MERRIDRSGYFPDLTTQTKFIEIMEDKKNLPVLVHDSSGHTRAAMLASVWLIKGKGLSAEEVIKIVERIIDTPVTKEESDFIRGLKN
ncbi:MAG: hypothetical protein E4H40_04800 [Candidatus Brocadiia bacterium]|nr:MAG: hypothetical protein E4H40_04800 [Candidatus Brocadiia bacterium]